MPYNRRYRKKKRFTRGRAMTRFNRYKRNYRSGRYNVVPHKSLFGNSKAVKMKYFANISLDPSAVGEPGVHVFRANSLFDPDFSATGHQPRGFDEVISLYQHYTVIHSKCTAWFTNTLDIAGQTDGLSMIVGIALNATVTPRTATSDYLESRNVTHSVIGNFNNGNPVRRVITYTPKKFLNITKPMTTMTLKGSATSSPDEDALFHVFIAPIAFASDQGNIQIGVNLEFVSVFTEPKLPGES